MTRQRSMMRAIVLDRPGGPELLTIGSIARPTPNPDELLIEVQATALNRADLLQRQGKYPPPAAASPILGLEVAGTVAEVGSRTAEWSVGDRVCGLLPGGGYAEYAVLHHALAISVQPQMTFQEAAAIPEVFLTAYQALHWFGELDGGKHVLVHAGASGVGTAAIQLVKAAGSSVYITASAGKHGDCLALGADLAIDYHSENFADRVLNTTNGRGVDIILDVIGAPYFQKNVDALALDGRIVMLAAMGGATVEEFTLGDFFRKRVSLFASTLRNRSLEYKIRLTAEFAKNAMPLFKEGVLKPVVDSVFAWEDVAEAHRYMAANRNVGKIVLTVRP